MRIRTRDSWMRSRRPHVRPLPPPQMDTRLSLSATLPSPSIRLAVRERKLQSFKRRHSFARSKLTRASSHSNGCRISLTSIGTIAAKRRRKLPDCFSAIRNMQRMPNYYFRPLPLTWTLVRHSSACSPNHGPCLRFRAGRRSSSLFLIWRESRPRMSWQSSNRLDSLRVHNPLKAQPSRHRRWIKTSDTSRQDAADQAVAGRKAFPSAGLLHTRSCTGRGAEVRARACRQYRRRFLAGPQTPC
jgi:hypothetical protein